MIKKTIFLLISLTSNLALADIYKYVDSNGRVTYTNLRIHNSGGTRNSLAKLIIKTPENHYKFRENNIYPTFFHSFSDRFSPRNINKSRFSNLIANAAYRHGVEEKLVHAVIQTESAYNANAVSHAGAVGLMQLMPDTARRYGVLNRTDPVQNVDGGTRYLRDLLGMFNYNLKLAVAAYNAGENAVIRYNNSIPPYPETQNYVRQVLSLYHRSL
ncbi:soluble lytic murein transglycosylase-like protein [Methyloglobulus morosus KoM1]|uniref:Soluble lytic murein transglycosylase-like protein n=1 Tax=Methyloglobulus morosus KoM1 TaxID=1116472 RepID=V5BIM7_9GAMM|nr:lytic transglycosylase domain-containing protein [Methyloglobulus morosus]ESS73150.1 soluble lytic murein transglycosylase-like protein [Methyloglobulus morosus KoM1]